MANSIHFAVTLSNGCSEAPVYRTVIVDGEVERGRVVLLDLWSSAEAFAAEDERGIIASSGWGVSVDDAVKDIVGQLGAQGGTLRLRRHYVARRIRKAA